ncbi:MAG: serine/threonine-protein kinase, partial [Gemmataceae bacterium]
MAVNQVCPQGHCWTSGTSGQSEVADTPQHCPKCGAAPSSSCPLDTPSDLEITPSYPWNVTVPPPSSASDSLPQIPGYELLEEIGRGGAGVIYRARHRASGRIVALKMLSAGGHAAPTDLLRFRAEAQAVCRVQHPHIVRIDEVGEHQGLPFFALEYMDRGSLAQALGNAPLPPRYAAELVEMLARAVQVAHDAGILHRDIKPANVLLSSKVEPRLAAS